MAEGLEAYGLPGIVIGTLAFAVMYLYRRQDKKQEQIEKDLRDLRERFDQYIDEDRKTMFLLIQESTIAMEELKDIIHEHHSSN